MNTPKLILASASPRRRSLLDAAGLAFEIIESGIDEDRDPAEAPAVYASRMACEKAQAVSQRYRDALVLGADTIVVLDNELMLKPQDAHDARRMLAALSARTHTVVTAFALARDGRVLESAPITAQVTFYPLAPATIERYVATGEPFDKAGGYGIQARGAEFIERVEGSRDTVMGLPVAEVIAALRRRGIDA